MANWQTLCPAADISDGQAKGFDPGSQGHTTVFVLRQGSQWRAWRDWCPHWDTGPMAWRRDAYLSPDGLQVICAAHGARFDALTGVCVLGPCIGQSLRPVGLRIDNTQHLQINTLQLKQPTQET